MNHVRQLRRDQKIFFVPAQITKTKTYCGFQKDCNCKRSFTIRLHRGSWLIILKFAKRASSFNHQFFPSHLQVLILSVPCLRELPLECQVPLSCNFMGYIFAIEISGDEIKFALKWFWSKITLCEAVSLSLTVIGRDCRKIGGIAVSSSSWGLGIKEGCVFCGEVCSFLV